MDLDDSGDASMNDGDIITSTELYHLAHESYHESEPGNSFGIENGHFISAKSRKESLLKGNGLKRDKDSYDQHLTGLKDAPRPPKFSNLPYASSQTGLVYDVRMRFHVEAVPTEDDVHPEDPRRIHAIFEAFVQAGLAWREGSSSDASSSYYMGRIDTRLVTEEEVRLVHTKGHWDWVQSLSTKSIDELVNHVQHPGQTMMDSVYLSPSTPYCAALSAGGAIEACRAVMLGKVKNVFAVIRPPGHHAEREDAKGFCFYDNVSIAAKVCQKEFGDSCRKVFILDWDVHHGNGIQQANYDDPNVLYISLHVHERGKFYPEMSYRDHRPPYGDHAHCGEGAGLGRNVNIPWSKKGMGDADYIYAFQQVVMPIAQEFDPDLVIIAAGFDAAEGDMLGGCKVTPAGYAHMTHMLMSLAGGRLAVCLEGGYNLDSIARSACAVGRTLMGEPPDRLATTNPSKSGVDDIKLVLQQQSRFWDSLYPKDITKRLEKKPQGERVHDIIRNWQATTLWENYKMTPLFIHRDSLSKSFENQVLATPNYMDQRPLLVILHDPPEMIASPDPRTGKIELHNTWIVRFPQTVQSAQDLADSSKTDAVKTYVASAVKQGFAVIDVNLPKHITDDGVDDDDGHVDANLQTRVLEATQLLTYLWDNYIEIGNATNIFLMGTNIGHWAIASWIKAHEDSAIDFVDRTFHFITDVSLQACRSQTNDTLAPWYARTSMVFVADTHGFWTSEYAQRPKKKFGRLLRSEHEEMSEMLVEHKDQVLDTMIADCREWLDQRQVTDEEDIMEVEEQLGADLAASTQKMPPVGNFALSPAPRASAAAGIRSPRLPSPTKASGMGGFGRKSRSPAR